MSLMENYIKHLRKKYQAIKFLQNIEVGTLPGSFYDNHITLTKPGQVFTRKANYKLIILISIGPNYFDKNCKINLAMYKSLTHHYQVEFLQECRLV